MSELVFAIAVIMPEADTTHMVEAAVEYKVHIIDKEPYSPEKNYVDMCEKYRPAVNGAEICLLFIFGEDNAIFACNDSELQRALVAAKNAVQILS